MKIKINRLSQVAFVVFLVSYFISFMVNVLPLLFKPSNPDEMHELGYPFVFYKVSYGVVGIWYMEWRYFLLDIAILSMGIFLLLFTMVIALMWLSNIWKTGRKIIRSRK